MKVLELVENFRDSEPETEEMLRDRDKALGHQITSLWNKLHRFELDHAIMCIPYNGISTPTEGIIVKSMPSMGAIYYSTVEIIDSNCIPYVLKLVERINRTVEHRREVLIQLGPDVRYFNK
jgi:hypothetical protein